MKHKLTKEQVIQRMLGYSEEIFSDISSFLLQLLFEEVKQVVLIHASGGLQNTSTIANIKLPARIVSGLVT